MPSRCRVSFAKMVFALSVGLVACDSSNGGGEFDDFVGTWRFDATSSFNLSCAGQNIPDVTLWNDLVFAPGTLTDLIESTSQCQFAYDVKGKAATITSPDPFTGVSQTCTSSGQFTDDTTGTVVDEKVTIVPTPGQWTFTLADTTKGQAPKASLTGGAQWTEVLTPAGGVAQTLPCTYAVMATLTKIAKAN